MSKRVTWRVQEAPMGPYRSFFRRGWPSGEVNQHPAFNISCEEEYTPKRASSGEHAPLTVRIAHWSRTPEEYREHGAFRWRKLKERPVTLKEAKALAESFLESNPDFPIGPKGEKL